MKYVEVSEVEENKVTRMYGKVFAVAAVVAAFIVIVGSQATTSGLFGHRYCN